MICKFAVNTDIKRELKSHELCDSRTWLQSLSVKGFVRCNKIIRHIQCYFTSNSDQSGGTGCLSNVIEDFQCSFGMDL